MAVAVSERRGRGTEDPAVGIGECDDPTAANRLQFRECYKQPCSELYHNTPAGKFAQCASKVDLIILLDGGGGLGSSGWRNSQTLVTNCPRTRRLAHVQVSLLLFSGPPLGTATTSALMRVHLPKPRTWRRTAASLG